MAKNPLVKWLGRGVNGCLAPLGLKLLRAAPPRRAGPDLHQLIL